MAGTPQATGNALAYNNFRVPNLNPLPLPANFATGAVDVRLTKYTILGNNLLHMLTAATGLHANAVFTPLFTDGTVILAQRLTWVTAILDIGNGYRDTPF